MFWIRIRMDPFHFGKPDPDPFQETDTGNKIMENFYKNHQKFQEYQQQKFKLLNFCLTVINFYLMNNKTNHFFGNIYCWSKKVLYQNETDPKHWFE